MTRRRSLKRPLIVFPLLFQFATLTISFATLLAIGLRLDSGGPYADEQITRTIARSVAKRSDGGLVVRSTPELVRLRRAAGGLWFVVEDDAGRSVAYGDVPRHYRSFVGRLSELSYAQLRDRRPPYDLAAVVRRETTPAGAVTILAHGELTELSFLVLMASNVFLLPIFLLLVLTSFAVTPWIVKRSLAGVSRAAREAEQIDASRRGRRLSEDLVPTEIAPLVQAFNEALRRLDEGYERQRRFIASAAHELRTPIAILRAKVEAGAAGRSIDLYGEVQRLATVAEQLLDIERLDTDRTNEPLDLGVVIKRVVADLAPLLLGSGRTIDLSVEQVRTCRGDEAALERVAANLIQNAVEHGGHHVGVRVDGTGFEVEDDGPGIPPEERERVFEPFHRLRHRSTGSGLGLNLVQQVVQRHGGRVSILPAPAGGTIVRVELPGC